MKQTEQLLLLAIQKSLWNIENQFPADADWDAVLEEAENQTVLGLVINTVPDEYREKWKNKATAITASNIRGLYTERELVELLQRAGIPVAILKGTAASVYYPVPLRRSMGDIDCIVPKDRFEEANQLLMDHGFHFVSEHSLKRHNSYKKDSVTIELHYHFSYTDLDVEAFIDAGWNQLEWKTVDGVEFPMLPKLANGLVLLAHMLHHFKTSLGLRQAIDWMMYVSCVLDDAFWNAEFKAAADQVGLTGAAVTATRMCQLYLGLSDEITWCKDADLQLCWEMMELLFSSGNFGRKQGTGASIETVTSLFREIGILQYLQIAGEYNWKAFHRHRWLKPFAWLYQIFRYTRQTVMAKRSGSQIKADLMRGNKRSVLYQKLRYGIKS